MYTLKQAKELDLEVLASLALLLWPDHSYQEFIREFPELLSDSEAAVYLAYVADTPAGFAQCQLRHDYVEGRILLLLLTWRVFSSGRNFVRQDLLECF